MSWPHISEHYLIRGTLGRGGMSTVYDALELDSQREVAIKVIQIAEGSEEVLRRFFSELLLTAGVQHPNIVRIHDFGVTQERGHPFIVMERLSGLDLDGWLRARGPMHASRCIPLFIKVLDAVASLHERSIVHKDIKPANLFFCKPNTWDESLVLTDFGIAHATDAARATQPGYLACTPQYSAPEYLTAQHVGPALDVYQLGLVLAEMLLGWPLVDEPSIVQCITAHLQGRLRIPRLLYAGPLGPLLRDALAIDPGDRFPNARAMADALAQVDANALELQLELVRDS